MIESIIALGAFGAGYGLWLLGFFAGRRKYSLRVLHLDEVGTLAITREPATYRTAGEVHVRVFAGTGTANEPVYMQHMSFSESEANRLGELLLSK